MSYFSRLIYSYIFWGAWFVIPFIMEFIPSIRSLFILKRRHRQFKKREPITYLPYITIIIPVYNSEKTLYECLQSVNDSTYDNEFIKILLVNNKPDSNDFAVYAKAQTDFPTLQMQWLESKQGKSKALNMALYNSEGKYIINVDSDGLFEPTAIRNMIEKFEGNPDIKCMTGAILTTPSAIDATRNPFLRLLRKLEFMEYAQAFLAGRSYAADNNEIYTLSGAFSAFRREAVLSSRLYNTETICEDTQMTFQMKYLYGNAVDICEDAIFYVDPIDDINKLYTQRQRWQRGSLEVSKMFLDRIHFRHFFSDEAVRTVLYDHTLAFPRMIWYVVTLYFIHTKASGAFLFATTIGIYLLYALIAVAYFINACTYMRSIKDSYHYYLKHCLLVGLLPAYNFMIFFFRVAGVINSIGTDSTWKTSNLTDERDSIKAVIRKDFKLHDKKNKVA